MAPIADQRSNLTINHRAARQKLDTDQHQRMIEEDRQRQERIRTGMRGLWDKLTGKRAEQIRQNELERQAALDQQQKQRDDLIAAQLLERQRLQTQIDQARKDHLRQTQDLHCDLSRFKKGDLSVFPKVDKTGGVHQRPKPTPTKEKSEQKQSRRPQPDKGVAAERETLKSQWHQVALSPRERLEKMSDQAVETGSIERTRENRLAAFKQQRLQNSPNRDCPSREW